MTEERRKHKLEWQRQYNKRKREDPERWAKELERRKIYNMHRREKNAAERKKERFEQMHRALERQIQEQAIDALVISTNAIREAEAFRAAHNGRHRYDCIMDDISAGYSDTEIAKEYKTDAKTIHAYRLVHDGKISKGHDDMPLHENILGLWR